MKNLFKKILLSVTTVIGLCVLFASLHTDASTLPIAGQTFTLAGGGLSGSASTITLQSFTITQTGQPIVTANLSSTFFATIEPGNKTKQEVAACTGVTQNTNGTATLTGCSRGMSPIYPYTASSTLSFVHAGGSQVIFSDPPQLFNLYTAKDNDETITGSWTFPTPTSIGNATRKDYVDNIAFSGAGVISATTGAKGVSQLATQLQTASSTSSGSSGPLVIPASNATSTYNASTAGLRVVVTQNNGLIDPNFLPTSFTAATAFSNIATSSATVPTTTVGVYRVPILDIGKNQIVFTSNGNFSIPSGITKIYAFVLGGGGGGGPSAGSGITGGGGAGGNAEGMFDVSATTTLSITIGAGGANNAAGGTTYLDGMASSTGGVAGNNDASASVGGSLGGVGHVWTNASTTAIAGSGAPSSGGGEASNGILSGTGGSTRYGGGGPGKTTGTGTSGTGYGSGGGGGVGAANGGVGMAGLVIIRY